MPFIKIYATDTCYLSSKDRYSGCTDSCLLIAGNNGRQDDSLVILLKCTFNGYIPDMKINHAYLYVFVNKNTRIDSMQKRLKFSLFKNLTDFCPQYCRWDTRPRILTDEVDFIRLNTCDIGSYVRCEITDLASAWYSGTADNYGLTIGFPRCGSEQYLVIESDSSCHPPFILLDYENCCDHRHSYSDFIEKTYRLQLNGGQVYSPSIEVVSSRTVSFFIKNLGPEIVDVTLQISPNGIDYIDDNPIGSVAPDTLSAAIPYKFAKYMRLKIKCDEASAESTVKIWYQSQLLNPLNKYI